MSKPTGAESESLLVDAGSSCATAVKNSRLRMSGPDAVVVVRDGERGLG
jgi:hypothetical protein